MIRQLIRPVPSSLTVQELEALAGFAGELADLAGVAILPHFRATLSVQNKLQQGFDPVTYADREAERVMREQIMQTYPEHGILGEEHGHHPGSCGLTWVLDPIDGTRAFISGLPLWGTLISLFDGSRPVLGVLDQPYLQERFVGLQGRSWMQKAGQQAVPLKTRDCVQLADAVLMNTDPSMFSAAAEVVAFRTLADQVKMSRHGGDCYAYAMLAAGFVDLVVEADLQPYDIHALIPIVEQAGGVVSDWSGQPAINGGQVVAAGSRQLHQQALQILQSGIG